MLRTKVISILLGNSSHLLKTSGLSAENPVIIYRTYRKNGIKHVDVVHDDSQEVWKNVSLSTLIPLEYRDIDTIFYQD